LASYPSLPARYSKGTLKLRKSLRLPEGTEVWVTVRVARSSVRPRRPARRKYLYPNRPLPRHTLGAISGMASLGGDALADAEALYDSD
jgi:hypothetical protein